MGRSRRLVARFAGADPDHDAGQRALHEAFDTGGSRQYIDESEPDPPMEAEDAAWAAGIVRGN